MLGKNKLPNTFAGTSRVKRHLRFCQTISMLIGESSIQLAAVKNRPLASKIIACDKIYLPSNLDKEGRRNFIASEINSFIEHNKCFNTRYLLGVAGSETTFRKLTLPALPRSELSRAVYWEANKRIPFGLESSCYGYYLDPIDRAERDRGHIVSLIAVPRSNIEEKLEILRPLGITVSEVWHEQEAIGLMLPRLKDFDKNKTYALINIQKDGSMISYYRGSHLEFTHSNTIGTESLTARSEIPMTRDEFIEKLASEIQNSLDFYAGQFSSSYTSDLFLYGDLSYGDEITERLSEIIGLKFGRFPVENWQIEGSSAELDRQIPVSLGAVALALADRDLIDFLPPELQEKRSSKRFYRAAIPALVIIAVSLGLLWGSLNMQNEVRENRLQSTRQQIERFKNSDSYLAYSRIKRQLAADRAFLEKLQKEPTHLFLNLQELSRIVPKKIRLEQYDLIPGLKKTSLTLAGKATSLDPPPEIILAEFIAALESSPFYTNVHLSRHTKRNNRGEFVIDFQVEMVAVI